MEEAAALFFFSLSLSLFLSFFLSLSLSVSLAFALPEFRTYRAENHSSVRRSFPMYGKGNTERLHISLILNSQAKNFKP